MRRQFWFRTQIRPDRAKKGTGIACVLQVVMQNQSIASIAATSLSLNTKLVRRASLLQPRRNTIRSLQMQHLQNRQSKNRRSPSLLLQSPQLQSPQLQSLRLPRPCVLRVPHHHTPHTQQFQGLHRQRRPRLPKRQPHPRRNRHQCIIPGKRRSKRSIPRDWSKPANDQHSMCLKKFRQFTAIDSR